MFLVIFFSSPSVYSNAINKAQVLYEKGASAKALGRNGKAEKYFNLALAKDESIRDAHLGLIQIFISRKDNERGLAAAKRALKYFENDAEIWSHTGTLYFRTGDIESAEAAFQKAIGFDESNVEIVLKAAQFYQDIGQGDYADELSSRVLNSQ